jgi:hypothetical protein
MLVPLYWISETLLCSSETFVQQNDAESEMFRTDKKRKPLLSQGFKGIRKFPKSK